MKCQSLFSGKIKKYIIKLSSAEFALRVINVNDLLSKSKKQTTKTFYATDKKTIKRNEKKICCNIKKTMKGRQIE